MVKKALAVGWKELQVLSKDRGQLAVLFLMPVMFASVIGSAFGGGAPEIEVYVVNQDTGPYGASMVEALQGIEALRVTELESVEQADRQVADGEALAAVVIPADLSRKIDAHEGTGVRVIVDPTQQRYGSIVTGIMNDVVTPAIYQGEIQYGIRAVMDDSEAFDQTDPQTRGMIEAVSLGVVMTQLQEALENPQIGVEATDLAGVETESLSSAYSYTTPSYAVMFAFFIVGTIAASIMSEKEEGTFRRLLASPLRRGSLIAGKMLAYMVVVSLQVMVVFGVGSSLFGVPLGRSPLGLLLLTTVLALAATSLGMLVAALARTRSQAEGVSMVLGIVLGAVGGAAVPIPPKGFLHLLSQFTPHAHAIEGYVQLTAFGAGVVEVLPQVGLLAAVGAGFFLIAIWRFRFE